MGHRGIRYLSSAILHIGDSKKISKLNSFVPKTMIAVEVWARVAKWGQGDSRTWQCEMGRREAGLSSELYNGPRVWHEPWFHIL